MKLPEGYVVIYQPKYTVPSVFDLNDRGIFSERPKVSAEWGYRILCDKDCRCMVQVAMLLRQPGKDLDTGKAYEWRVKEARIALDEPLVPDPEAVAQQLPDKEMRSGFITEFNAWHDNFIPLKDDAKVDTAELKKKLAALVADAFDRRRKDLMRRNQHWVLSNIPRRVHDFKYGLYDHVRDNLYPEYQRNGGEDSEDNLVKKIALFSRVLDDCYQEGLRKPDGSTWKNEDEVWQCWIGFAGSEVEAQRVCRTMDAVFRDLQL